MNDLDGLAFDAACDCHDRGRLRMVDVVERLFSMHPEALARLAASPAEIEHAARDALAEVIACADAEATLNEIGDAGAELTFEDRF